MAMCEYCNQEMLTANGCFGAPVEYEDGTEVKPIRYGDGAWAASLNKEAQPRCHDCNAKWGEYHHPGCDMEECPICHGQLISCNCTSFM